MPIYVAGDVRAIQGYVFASTQLLEMRGASALIDFFDRSVVRHQVKEHGGELISSGGGNFLAVFEDAEDAADRVQRLRRLLLAGFLDLTGGQELLIETLQTDEPFRAAHALLQERVRHAKHRPAGGRQLASTAFLKRCESCGREEAEVGWRAPGAPADAPRQWLGPVCDRKRRTHDEMARARKEKRKARLEVFGVEGGLEVPPLSKRLDLLPLPTDFDEVVGGRGELDELFGGDDLAILVADGNGLGSRFRALESAGEYRDLSRRVDQSLRDALDAAIAEAFGDNPKPRLQVLICGGDDLIVALPARHAAKFACRLMEEFRVATGDPPSETGLAAGLLISKLGFPFRQGHALAEELLGWAKRRCREEDLLSALQIHRVTASHVQSLGRERSQVEIEHETGGGWAYGMAGPYTPEQLRAVIGLAADLRRKVSPSQRGRLREILSPRDDGPISPLDPAFPVPRRVVEELEAWRVRQDQAPFDEPLAHNTGSYLREERRRNADGTWRTFQRWVLADALTLAALGEA